MQTRQSLPKSARIQKRPWLSANSHLRPKRHPRRLSYGDGRAGMAAVIVR